MMKSVLSACLLLALLSIKANSQHTDDLDQARQGFQQDFQGMDANGDGTVYFSELLKWFLGPFDQDSNGEITLDEFTKDPNGLTHEDLVSEFEFFDKNLDHVVTSNEVQIEFRKMDKDQNGALTETEFVDFFMKMYVDKSYPSFG